MNAIEVSSCNSSNFSNLTTNWPLCDCSIRAIVKTSWTDANPGRRFFGCSKYGSKGACDFFMWYDNPMPDRANQLIFRMKQKLKQVEEENVKLKLKTRKLQWITLACLVVIIYGYIIV